MTKFIYYVAIVWAVVSLIFLFGVAGASDTGAPMADILPRAMLCLVCCCPMPLKIDHVEPARRANGPRVYNIPPATQKPDIGPLQPRKYNPRSWFIPWAGISC